LYRDNNTRGRRRETLDNVVERIGVASETSRQIWWTRRCLVPKGEAERWNRSRNLLKAWEDVSPCATVSFEEIKKEEGDKRGAN